MEPKIGEIITVENVKYITELAVDSCEQCKRCHLLHKLCWDIACMACARQDNQTVIFKEVKEMEIKIQIPDNCELIKDGDTYIVKEKKQGPPRSWEEFCEKYPLTDKEAFIDSYSNIKLPYQCGAREVFCGKNWCVSEEEAEAFLALMQLRQLRKAWVGDWEPVESSFHWGIYKHITMGVMVDAFELWTPILSFPTKGMAEDFLSCFRDLCEKAKILL